MIKELKLKKFKKELFEELTEEEINILNDCDLSIQFFSPIFCELDFIKSMKEHTFAIIANKNFFDFDEIIKKHDFYELMNVINYDSLENCPFENPEKFCYLNKITNDENIYLDFLYWLVFYKGGMYKLTPSFLEIKAEEFLNK